MELAWDDLRLFLAVADGGSLSEAARRLKIGQPTVTRRLALLEDQLGVRLFRRGAKGALPTAAGERLLQPARRMAEWAGEAARTAERTSEGPAGMVRVTAPPGVAFDFVAPFGAWLSTHHPGLRLEVLSSMQYLDLARGEADLALRLRKSAQAGLEVLHTLHLKNAVHVARSLLARLPRKPTLRDLPWVGWAPPHEEMPPNPQLREQGVLPSFTSDHFLVNLAAAEAGAGAIVLSRQRHRFSRPSQLVALPIDLGPFSEGELHLVCARSALDIPRVRLVAQAMVAELQRMK